MKQKHWQVSVFDKTSETIRDDTFYTTDTEAYLTFELIDEDFTPDSAMVAVYNVYGKATISEKVEIADGIVSYEIPEDAIGHPGGWRTQVIFTKDNEDYTTKIIEFDVGGHLLDNKKPAIVDIENWNSFIAHAEELIDDWEQLEEIRQANEQQRELAESVRQNEFETNETTRQSEFETNETSRQTNELVREEAENNRQSTFETNEAERESTFKTKESTRQANELIREEAEGNRQSTFEENEVGRQSEFEENELARESAETVRVANEEERISKDSERDSKIEVLGERIGENEEDLTQHKIEYVEEISKKANKQQEGWITPTLLNGWVADTNNPVGYYKDEFGVVRCKGRISGGAHGQSIFTFPSGYRPVQMAFIAGTNTLGQTFGYIVNRSSGQIDPRGNVSGSIHLESVTFRSGI